MTLASLVLRNLLRRPARSGLTAAGVAIAVGLIVALLSIAAGVRSTANDLIHVGRADFGLFQAGANDLTRSLLPVDLVRKVAADRGVAQVAPLFLHVGGVRGRDSFLLFGLDPQTFPYRRLVIVRGRRATGREAMVGDHAGLGLGPGDTLQVGRHRFRIGGVYHSGDRFED